MLINMHSFALLIIRVRQPTGILYMVDLITNLMGLLLLLMGNRDQMMSWETAQLQMMEDLW